MTTEATTDQTIEQLRAELTSFVEASLEPCDYTVDHECEDWESTDYERARANIVEMHRVLNERGERLLEANDDRDGLYAELTEAGAEIAKLQQALSKAERHDADVRLEVEREFRDEAAKAVTA